MQQAKRAKLVQAEITFDVGMENEWSLWEEFHTIDGARNWVAHHTLGMGTSPDAWINNIKIVRGGCLDHDNLAKLVVKEIAASPQVRAFDGMLACLTSAFTQPEDVDRLKNHNQD